MATHDCARWPTRGSRHLPARCEWNVLDEVAAVRNDLADYDKEVSAQRMKSCESWPVQMDGLGIRR